MKLFVVSEITEVAFKDNEGEREKTKYLIEK